MNWDFRRMEGCWTKNFLVDQKIDPTIVILIKETDQKYMNATFKSCPFGLGLRKFAFDPFIVIFSAFLKKIQVVVWFCP